MNIFRNSRGFTLIELLVTISIISILVSVVMASVGTAKMKANDARRVSDLHEIQSALELYYTSHNTYPVGSFDSRDSSWDTLASYLAPEHIPSLPIDPKNGRTEGAMCGNCAEYYYHSVDGSDFIISTYLATEVENSNQFGPYYSIAFGCTATTFWDCE